VVELTSLTPQLIDFIASEKYLSHLYPIRPPDAIVITYKNGTDVYVIFRDGEPKVELRLSTKPSILWFVKRPEEVVKKLLFS